MRKSTHVSFALECLIDFYASHGNELDILTTHEGAQTGPEYVLGLGEMFGNGMTESNIRDGGLFAARRHRGIGKYITLFSTTSSHKSHS